jgi:DnaJ-class molecular chaperone
MNFEEIDNSRKTLGLGEKATLEQIKKAYRILSIKWHPDTCEEKDHALCHEKMTEIVKAHRVLMNYVKNYSYPFTEETATIDDPEEFHRKHFGKPPF